ncbi:hypothetical protein, partial [Paraflavitalea sp. sgz302552]|uniref:hypothetical protein n=2 Tax=unclassified Paraflavitalea TaxID=2798305 RepID=UPI003D33AB41
MKVLLMILISTFMVSFCWAQKENNVWNFGYGVQANFNSGNPVFEPGSQLNSWEGCSSISDRNGNLLFYSDGMNVWDRSNAIMQNGNLLQGDTISTISSLIVPFPGSNTLYYLFTINSLESKPGDLKYNIIDITLNGGLGGVVVGSKNIPLETGLLEKVAAVRHANTKDVWLVCHSANNSNFIVYNINCNGIDIASRSVQSIGLPVIVAPVGNAIGYMRFSPNCRRLAIANFWTNIQVFDFDNETGILSNYQLVDEKPAPISAFYGIQFSPNSQVLYATELTNKGDPGNYYLWQYDLNAPNIPLSRYEVYSEKNGNPVPPAAAMQLANNRQVYVAHSYAGFLSTIANPNVIGIGCNFSYSSVAIPNGNLSGLGLPAFVEGIDITLLGNDISVCEDSVVTLRTPILQNTTKQWSNSSTADTLNVTQTGYYWVDIFHNGCTYRDSIYVEFRPKPIINFPNDTTVCANLIPVNLTRTIPGATYVWNDGSIGNSILVDTTGLYWLEATLNGCSRRDSIQVNIAALPTYSFGADTSVCEETIVTLNPGVVGTSYLWSTGATSTFITTDTSGTFWCKVTNAFGCTYTDTINVQVRPKPVVNLGADVIICNDAAPLRIGQTIAGATYNWSTMETSDSISITNTGLYWLEATINGCSRRDSINVTINPVTTYSFGADTSVCEETIVTLNPGVVGTSYLWSTGATSTFITTDTSGTFWCKVTNAFGCTYTDTINVQVRPKPVVNLGADVIICNDAAPLRIGQTIAGATYNWSTSENTDSIQVNTSNVYWLEATINGCSR